MEWNGSGQDWTGEVGHVRCQIIVLHFVVIAAAAAAAAVELFIE